MAISARHQTGHKDLGFWRGSEDTFGDNCNAGEMAAIEASFNAFIGNQALASCFPSLVQTMKDRWPSVPVDCCFDDTRPPRGGEVQTFFFFCNTTDAQRQLEIAKGLTQLAGGHQIDVKAVQFACFGAPGLPSANDLNDFLNEPVFGGNQNEREGVFVIWNKQTGEIWQKTTTTTSGGFWGGSSTTTVKGTRCFGNPGWQR